MDSTRIAALLHPYIEDTLSPTQLAQVSTYLDLLLRWNSKMNLTAIREPENIVSRHFGESFFLATQLFGDPPPVSPFVITSEARDLLSAPRPPDVPGDDPTAAHRAVFQFPITNYQLQILDLGSGAGFPAIPLKIFRPDLTITLIEAHHRKAVFLREVLRALNLEAEVKNVRAEDLPTASADLVTLRAVEKFDSILPTAARLIRAKKEPVDPDHPRASEPTAPLAHSPLSTVHRGLALLIGSAQISHAQKLLPNWRFHPEIPIPNSHNRVIQLLEPNW